MSLINVNIMSNRIHEWGEPEQSPLKAMILPRVGSIALAALETLTVLYNSLLVATRLPITLFTQSISVFTIIFPKNVQLQTIQNRFSPYCFSKMEVLRIAKTIVCLASTLFFWDSFLTGNKFSSTSKVRPGRRQHCVEKNKSP